MSRPASPLPRALRDRRWIPPAAILALFALALAWVWLGDAPSRQDRVMKTIAASALATILLLLWAVLFSRLRWRTRLGLLAGLGALGALAVVTLEPRGVSGDVVPRFGFKWSPRADERLATDLEGSGAIGARTSSRDDFPQFLGRRRNATVDGVTLARDWQAQPPRALWRQPIGAGNSGFAVVGEIAVTHEQRGDEELVVAYGLTDGEVLWSHGVVARHEDVLGGDGPRATPAIAGGAVYSLGATGILDVLDLATGARRWSADVLADAGAAKPRYGLAGSPLVLDDVVVVIAGGAARNRGLLAYDRDTGAVAWAGGSYPAAYASPVLATFDGVEQIVVFHGAGLTGHDLRGAVLWRAPWPPTERTSQPVALPGDRLFVSSGYGVGAKLFRIRRDGDTGEWSSALEWESQGLKAKFTQVVHRDGYLYGLDDGILVALDVETGERAWKRGRYGHGQILLVGDLLLVTSEKGEVALVEASPEAYRELGRFQAIEGKTWNTPALAGRHLLIRNGREAACYALPLASD